MTSIQTIRGGFFKLLLLGGLTAWPVAAVAAPPGAAPRAPRISQVYVSEPVAPDLSPALRDLPSIWDRPAVGRELVRRIARPPLRDLGWVPPEPPAVDPLVGRHNPFIRTPAPLQVFNGIPFTGSYPPDPVGDVGPNHYVQAVNVSIAVYDKNGAVLVAPKDLGTLWAGMSQSCANGNGDPIVLYDNLADRWFVSQLGGFGGGPAVCVAVSQTPDPGGQYHLYRFAVPDFPDYQKFGVWHDGYYMTANESSYTAYAFDRARMLMGQMATFQRFAGEQNLLLPADLDGSTPPPMGAPEYFYTFKDDNDHGGADRLEIFELHVDWVNTANTTFNLVASLPIAPYNYTVCGFFVFNCIRQQNTNQRLDAVSEWPMHRLVYRNFGGYEMLLGNFTVDVTGNDDAGIRWFELRKNSGGPWMLHQEGTHAPDTDSRFMGSIAMDGDGNIALGYSVSSSSTVPTLRYATRIPDDPPGTLQMEATLQAGGGSQTSNERFGDYSSMNVDPTDDCTFYYTMEYIPAPGADWNTIVGKFRIPGCGGAPNGDPCTASSDCQSDFCVDGVCCDTACGAGNPTDCQACSMAAGATVNGTCSPRPATIECRASAGPCDAAENCDGTALDCPADALAPAATPCRGAADSCDLAEACDGMTATCPADVLAPDGTACPGGTCNAGQCNPSGSGSGGGGPKLDPKDEGGCGCRIPGAATGDSSDRTPAAAGLALAALALAGALRRRRSRFGSI